MKKISFIIALFAILITLNITNVNASQVVIKHNARGESTGGEVPGPTMEAHTNGIFCRDHSGIITFRHYGDSRLGSSGADIDGTVESSRGSYDAFTGHSGKIFSVTYPGENFQNLLSGDSQQTYSVSDYGLEEYNPATGQTPTRPLTLAEQYIFAHSNDEFVQDMFWKYLDNGTSAVPSGGTAKDIVEEALTYEQVVNTAIDPVLHSDDVTVMYSFTKKEFLVGPLSLDYLRYYIWGCEESEVAKAENNNKKIDLCGIKSASIILDGRTVALSANDFVYPEGRSAEALTEPDYEYPYPGETFYIRLYMSDVGDAKNITNINFNFQKYCEGTGMLHNLSGAYEVTQWTPKSKSKKAWCSSGYDNSYDCPGGTKKDPCEHGCVGGHWVDDKHPCVHGKVEGHEYIESWTEWLEASAGYCVNSQLLVSVYTDVTVNKEIIPTYVDLNVSLRMDYGGVVWEDARTGKNQDFDGVYAGVNMENGIPNVKVTLYDRETNIPYASTYTDAQGRYFFSQIKMGQYYAVFDYDGQTWSPTTYFAGGEANFATNSKAQEYTQDRINFNNKFKEIIEQGGVAADGSTITPIEYDTNTLGKPYAITNSGYKALSNAKQFGGSTTSNYGGNVEGDYANFRMSATTMDNNNNIVYYPRENEVHIEDWNKYITSTLYTAIYPKILQINLGLVRRTQADFDVKKDVYKVIIQVNGKTEEYTYSSRQNITNSFDVEVKREPSYANQIYNRAIYKSDYNYRISDYNTGKELTEGSDRKEGSVQDVVDAITSAKAGTELRVFVIYKLTFRNASEVYSGTVNELVDYYDEEYSYTGESWYGTPKTTENVVEWVETPKYGAAKDYPGLDALYTTTTSNIMLKSGDQEEIYMKFEVKKHTDERGKENSIWLDENSETGEALGGKNNIVEITNYSTYKEGTTIEQKNNPENIEGKIDRDSKPNNTNPNDRATIEDDTDGAPELHLILHEGEERNIGGIIWEDERNNRLSNEQLIGNGTREENETKINGAVVQLIEKVEIDGNTYEYIWREMETGDDKYEYLDYDGNVQTGTIEKKKAEDGTEIPLNGQYFFEDYIPGNYIIRVIYGDNDHTIQIRANSANGWNDKSYNGQDYKSTIYKAVETNGYYDQAANAANPNTSKAKDNALRRLEVIDYSHTMSNHIGNVLSAPYNFPNDADLIQELRDNTWLYADTAVIVSEVEYNTGATEDLADSQNTAPIYQIENVGMGLEERPRTNLDLTKQIDNVIATLSGGTVMLDEKNGIIENLQEIPNTYAGTDENSKHLTRNYWQFVTDNELLQDMQIKIYYKLTVKNTGEIDTVGRTFDLSRRNSVSLKEAEEMLGSAYYYGTLDNVENVTTKVDKIIDYVDKYIGFDPEAETNKDNNWGEVPIGDLKTAGILSDTINITTNTTNNKSLMTDKLTDDELVPERADKNNYETSTILVLSRLLGRDGSTFDYTYNNIAEIIEFTNTVGRRDQGSTPGNADPHIINKTKVDDPGKEEEHTHGEKFVLENDTDISENFNILPPTGEDRGTMYYYIIAAISGLTAFALGIVLIKKYIL